jgi:hypothetical protein
MRVLGYADAPNAAAALRDAGAEPFAEMAQLPGLAGATAVR